MNAPLSGYGSNFTPDYSKEAAQVQMKKGLPDGSSKGVILSKDSLEVSFVKQSRIEAQEAEAGRPLLPPLFQMRLIDDQKAGDLSRTYYQALRNSLSPHLLEKLEIDERQPNPEERDPDLLALDASLKFEAQMLVLSDSLLNPPTDEGLIRAGQFQAFPDQVLKGVLSNGLILFSFLEHYVATIGPNDPSYEIFVQLSNQMKEALELLPFFGESNKKT